MNVYIIYSRKYHKYYLSINFEYLQILRFIISSRINYLLPTSTLLTRAPKDYRIENEK